MVPLCCNLSKLLYKMSCHVEQIADCGDISSIARALFVSDREDNNNWLCQCSISLSSCGNLLAVGYKNRLCLLTTQWISSTDSNSFLISWSGTMPSNITAILALSICPALQSSQNGPDWFCIIVGFVNGNVAFYTNTGHLILMEKLDEKPVMKISCHTGTYGTLHDDIHILYSSCECLISGSSLFQTLRNAKAQLARVQAGVQGDYSVDSRGINIKKWTFSDQEVINDGAVVGLELKTSYDHLLAASTYGGYETWYRSIPPVNTLILGAGVAPYIGFHYALEGGTTPPLQDVARAVANKIKSALPGWLGGGSENTLPTTEPLIRSEPLSMRNGLYDPQRQGTLIAISPDRRLAAFTDSLGRVAVLDIQRSHLIRLFKGCRDSQCAFIQIFDVEKKPQLSIIKEIKRAVFLVIYNPRKGLIDIRLMQTGNRVAVFTATKNGQLLYNTCGLVGAEKNYTHKKLNLPEFQCVLLDPDGKLKKFNIPFFYALEGENSDRAKDLHILRELREYIKKTMPDVSDYKSDIINLASKLKTIDLKKHCIEMLARKFEIPPSVIMSCVELFWDTLIQDTKVQEEDFDLYRKTTNYFSNLGLITLFYRNINNETTEDMDTLIQKIYQLQDIKDVNMTGDIGNQDIEFHLLEDDNCILERLLTLAQESNYKEHQHPKVSFADTNCSTYKEFISCFQLEENSKDITLKPEISLEKLDKLASDTFKSIFDMKNIKLLSYSLRASSIDAKVVIKLIIIHLMNMPLEKINIDLIEKFIAIVYYICIVTDEAKNIDYNETSPWWQSIRDILVEMPCPLRSMIVAMACKAAGRLFETASEKEYDAWESVTKENAKWGLLIGKLEDISILSIILMFNENFQGNSLPKLQFDDFNINLKYIYSRGKGSVTELIAKWLCGMGVLPEAIIANELIEVTMNQNENTSNINEDSTTYVFLENNRVYVDDNAKIFKWFSLLRRQFPLSTAADYILANMCWEYAIAWQKCLKNTDNLLSVVHCVKNITDVHLRLGLFAIIWSTYVKQIFEASCRLVNKVGKLPKDALCQQDVGFNSKNMVMFLEITTKYLDDFLMCSRMITDHEKQTVQYEKIWDESMPSLVEVAQDTKNINDNILNLNYQVSCTIYYQCHFNIKCSKPLDSLYDIDYQYIFDALTGNVVVRDINMRASEKLRSPRMKFITKVIRASIDTITTVDNEGPYKIYNNQDCETWIEKICTLADQWFIEIDFIRRQQVIGLYHLGYDTLAESILNVIKEPESVLPPLLAITTQRFKRSLEQSSNPSEWIVTVPPHLYKRLQNMVVDPSIPANPSLSTTMTVLQKVLYQVESKCEETAPIIQNIKLTRLMIDSCEVLLRRKL